MQNEPTNSDVDEVSSLQILAMQSLNEWASTLASNIEFTIGEYNGIRGDYVKVTGCGVLEISGAYYLMTPSVGYQYGTLMLTIPVKIKDLDGLRSCIFKIMKLFPYEYDAIICEGELKLLLGPVIHYQGKSTNKITEILSSLSSYSAEGGGLGLPLPHLP